MSENLNPNPETFVPLTHAAKATGYTAQTLRGWIRRGWIVGASKLPNGRIGIPSSELERITGGERG